MESLVQSAGEPSQALTAVVGSLLGVGSQLLVAFVLIVTRLSGMAVMSPVFGHPDVPLQVRVFVVLSLAFLTVPLTLSLDSSSTFSRLDRDQNNRLSADEIPEPLKVTVTLLRQEAGLGPNDDLQRHEFRVIVPVPANTLHFAWLAVCEFALGFAMSLGIALVMAALQLAGTQIDQQLGVSLGTMFNPDFDMPGSVSGETLNLLAVTLFLCIGGHTTLVLAILDTLHVLPPGYAVVTQPTLELLLQLTQQTLEFGIRISAPILILLSLVGLALGYVGHSIPQVNVLVLGFAVRGIAGLIIITAAMAAVGRQFVNLVPDVIQRVLESLCGFTI